MPRCFASAPALARRVELCPSPDQNRKGFVGSSQADFLASHSSSTSLRRSRRASARASGLCEPPSDPGASARGPDPGPATPPPLPHPAPPPLPQPRGFQDDPRRAGRVSRDRARRRRARRGGAEGGEGGRLGRTEGPGDGRGRGGARARTGRTPAIFRPQNSAIAEAIPASPLAPPHPPSPLPLVLPGPWVLHSWAPGHSGLGGGNGCPGRARAGSAGAGGIQLPGAPSPRPPGPSAPRPLGPPAPRPAGPRPRPAPRGPAKAGDRELRRPAGSPARAGLRQDWNATTPVFAEAARAMEPFSRGDGGRFGNPSSGHALGRECRVAVEGARAAVGRLVNARSPEEVVFVSCGTEADNWAVLGAVRAGRRRLRASGRGDSAVPHVVTSTVEHPAVTECLRAWAEEGLLAFTEVGVTAEGLVDPAAVEAAVTRDTVLCTVMHSNNEVGAVNPIREIASRVRAKQPGITVHTDAAQSLGKVSVDVQELGVDLATIVGHKFGAPKGVAALYMREGVELDNFLYGGGQERGRRGGTENVLLVAGLGAAAEVAFAEATATREHMLTMRALIRQRFEVAFPEEGRLRFNGPADPASALPNTLSVSVRDVDSSAVLAAVADRVAASAGAACHSSEGPVVSRVLSEMGVARAFALGTFRLSVGRSSTPEEVEEGVHALVEEIRAHLAARLAGP